eukprot:6179233-Pleurochrysis_carterae.AAC.3
MMMTCSRPGAVGRACRAPRRRGRRSTARGGARRSDDVRERARQQQERPRESGQEAACALNSRSRCGDRIGMRVSLAACLLHLAAASANESSSPMRSTQPPPPRRLRASGSNWLLQADPSTRFALGSNTRPIFTWETPVTYRAQTQEAFSLEVRLAYGEKNIVWASGLVSSKLPYMELPPTVPLRAATSYEWSVSIVDENGRASPPAAPVRSVPAP